MLLRTSFARRLGVAMVAIVLTVLGLAASVGTAGTEPETAINNYDIYHDNADFWFISDVADATFQCRLDTDEFAACVSPVNYRGLPAGTHTFEVRAVDSTGVVDSTPANLTFTSAPKPPPPPPAPANDGWYGAQSLSGTEYAGQLYGHGWYLPNLNPWTTWSRLELQVKPGETYLIAVDGQNGEYGDVQLSWRTAAATGDVNQPSVTMWSPEPGAQVTGTVTFMSDAFDDEAVDRVVYRIEPNDPSSAEPWFIGESQAPPYDVTLDTSVLEPGACTTSSPRPTTLPGTAPRTGSRSPSGAFRRRR